LSIVPLKLRSRFPGKSEVFRLTGASSDGSPVIAKRCALLAARIEQHVYEVILPRASEVSALRYHGYLEEPDGARAWLFIEDGGDLKPSGEHAALVARWLASLHGAVLARALTASLPDRGPAHYLEHLRVGRAIIEGQFGARIASLSEDDRRTLGDLLRLADRIEAAWQRICRRCEAAPRVLVHGDFLRKNVRVRESAPGDFKVLALDWETAGWGPSAADLAGWPAHLVAFPQAPSAVEVYLARLRNTWSGVTPREVARLAAVGTIFRLLAAVRWAGERLRSGSVERAMGHLRACAESFPAALAALDDDRDCDRDD
jgi:Ser/Thr protein kinase RdoA (MazF antagonist)